MHIELVTAAAVAAATTGTAATAVGSDSLTAKNGKGAIDIICAWQTNQTAGFGQIAFPSAHDVTRGYRTGVGIGTRYVFPLGMKMRINPQEVLAITLGATAVAGDVENMSMLVRYADMPGINARLITAAQVEQRMEKLTTIENSLASTAGPSYRTPETIIADSDLLLANRDYAVLGLTCRTNVHAIYMSGPDWSNIRIGCPGKLDDCSVSSQFFMLQSRMHGEACVPVFSSGNKPQTMIGVVTDENAGTFVVTAHLALLR